MRAASSESKTTVCVIPRVSKCCDATTASASRVDVTLSYRKSIDASGNADENQFAMTPAEAAITTTQTAMNTQSRRVRRTRGAASIGGKGSRLSGAEAEG